ncbi:MerR family transcriptional regulator [Clostridium sp. P21]|uniref:MerR family transcriptional regulator n=1 Tax=Clostridium muellerianum TaxID=2716538 RepID=A0A7Y0HMS6_9CLOT|nr:GyrI-like domain-containing protein [Clostridium muellerianum]NMM62475.1 MerR family transcriptional regulator [Clostridium muellerianum]
MYTIGQFSKIGKISTKMLRHYDKIGLIKPSFVNPENQYRYYEKYQVKDILRINKLKIYKFSLDEIKQIIEDKSNETLKKLLQKQINYITNEIEHNNSILLELKTSVENLKKGDDIMASKRNFEISVNNLEDKLVLSLRDIIPMDNISSLIGKVFQNIYRNNLEVCGNIMTVYYDEDFDESNADIEVCIPVDREFQTGTIIKTRILKGGLHAHTAFVGSYNEIGEAYAELTDWIEKNHYEIIGAPYDKYIKGPEAKCNPNEFITEVYFPIKHK